MSDMDFIKAAIGPVVVEILRRTSTTNGELDEEVIGSAFETAFNGLENGVKRVRTAKGAKFSENLKHLT